MRPKRPLYKIRYSNPVLNVVLTPVVCITEKIITKIIQGSKMFRAVLKGKCYGIHIFSLTEHSIRSFVL